MFQELLNNPSAIHPQKLQAESARQLHQKIVSSKFKLFTPESILPAKEVLLLGVASYSPNDLELLDKVHERASTWDRRISIYVIDIAVVESIEDLIFLLNLFFKINSVPRLFPWFFWPIRQTPFVIAMNSGQISGFDQGFKQCTNLLEDMNII